MSDLYGDDIITITDEDGVEYVLEVLATIEVDGAEYYALVPASDEEVDVLVKRVETAYELVKSGFTTAHEEATLDLYDAARRLELSGNEHVMSLGTAAKDLMLGMLGHTVVEDVDGLHDNVNAALAYVHSVLDEPVSEPQEEAELDDSAAK